MQRALAAGLLWLAFTPEATPHSWYPSECCSDRDCAPHAAADVEESAAGYRLKSTGEFVHRAAARPSPDADFHLCRGPTSGALLCFFAPHHGS